MATFYKGAGVGTHWHVSDARQLGFTARAPEANPSTEALIHHIASGTHNSPYISLTSSYAIAWHYAVFNSKMEPTKENPAYIYELEIDDSLPHGLNLIDPTKRLVHILPQPLRGIMDLTYMINYLEEEATNPITDVSPNLELQLIAMTFALRDAEILIHGYIPPFCVKRRYEVEFSLSDAPFS